MQPWTVVSSWLSLVSAMWQPELEYPTDVKSVLLHTQMVKTMNKESKIS